MSIVLKRREYTRPTANVPFYGGPGDTDQGRIDSINYLVNYHKNIFGLGNRYSIDYGAEGSLVAVMLCEISDEEHNALVAEYNDINSQYSLNMHLHDQYNEDVGIEYTETVTPV
jgi:hypothetical protein